MPEKVDKRTLALHSPAGFAWWASDETWLPAEHLLLLSRKIVDVVAGRCPRLMVFMPPRHGKSELISRYTPAWFLGRHPDKKVMLASYSDTFASHWGRRARDTFKENAPQLFGVRVNPETSGGQQWEVLGRDGIMVTAGVGGGITGKGADLLIIDDPVKNAQDAASEVIQEAQHEWWKSTARTRLQKGAGVIFVMTRWHEADLAGRLIADWKKGEGDEWEILSLPAFGEGSSTVSYPPSKSIDLGPDLMDRAEGDPLWPRMFDAENLTSTKRALGSYWFNALYQQRPSDAEGNLFKRSNFRYFEKLDVVGDEVCVRIFRDGGPEVFNIAYGRKFMTVDAAESEKKTADYSVCSTWIVTVTGDLLLWDSERVKFDPAHLKVFVRRKFFEQQPSFIAIEKKSAGVALLSELGLEGLPVVPLNPDADKVTRSLPAVARYEEHRIFHPMNEPWVKEDFEPELLNFPNAANDDQVDTVSMAAQQLPLLGGVHGVGRGTVRTGGDTLAGGLLTKRL